LKEQRIVLSTSALGEYAYKAQDLINWAQGTFLHEFAHHVHLNYISQEAREFWDGTWDPVKKLKQKFDRITPGELDRFFALLEKNRFDPSKTAKQLKGSDKVKFAYWLRGSGGMGDPLITPRQFRLTKRGKYLFGRLLDPGRVVEENYGYRRGTPEFEERVERVVTHVKNLLGMGYSSGLAISPKVFEKDPAVNEALESLYQELGIPTDYGRTNEKEDFAESFVFFMVQPEKLTNNARYRMNRTLWLSGFGGKPVMRLAMRVVQRFLGK
jgi:hypothetical protein